MPFTIVRNDITKLSVDAVVNAANTGLLMGGGVCGAIFAAAGAEELQAACEKLSPIVTGEAVVTGGFSMRAKYIIHTAGPVYRDGTSGEEALLRSCYKNSLELAMSRGCESIAFPLISSGIYGYPKDEALSVATHTIGEWLADNDMDVSLVVFDKSAFKLSQELQGVVQSFIDENYVDMRTIKHRELLDSESRAISYSRLPAPVQTHDTAYTVKSMAIRETVPPEYEESASAFGDALPRLDEPFSITLLKLIDLKGKSDVYVYKRANIDRKLFSKIRTGKGYMPGKKTVVALAIALELTLAETRDLLERAGFALSRSVMFDVIIEYFLTRGKYDVFEINNVLFEYDQPLLG